MNEQKFLDMFIQERINMLLLKLEQTKPKWSPEAEDTLTQASSLSTLCLKQKRA
ncbi:hypothetical protein LJC58_09230 [Lachnospiraceae bacterium OttesenSCG-928-D06]|nr:hypothetical protein [Lachnospiraceae bacterium OttesenSCG-928-D06]